MSLELNWSCSGSVSGEMVNVVNPRSSTSADIVNGPAWNLWWMKECLKEVGWTVVSSSDGSSASASDLWGSTFDATISGGKNAKIKYAAPGQARSWIALAGPAGTSAENHKLIIDFTTHTNISVQYNRIQIIATKGAISSGTTTSRPTGSSEFGLFTNNGCAASDLVFFDDNSNNTAQHRLNFHYTDDGAFYFSEAQVGKAKFTFILAFLPLQNTHAVDEHTWVLAAFDTYSGRSDSYAGNNPATSFTVNTYSGQTFYYESSGAITGRSHDGNTFISLAGLIPAISQENTNGSLAAIFFPNVLSVPNSSDSTYSDFPIVIVNGASGPIEFKGRLPDISWTSYLIPNGAVTPPKATASSTYERVKFGLIWLPWTSTQSPIL